MAALLPPAEFIRLFAEGSVRRKLTGPVAVLFRQLSAEASLSDWGVRQPHISA